VTNRRPPLLRFGAGSCRCIAVIALDSSAISAIIMSLGSGSYASWGFPSATTAAAFSSIGDYISMAVMAATGEK
jgi:hypothetical protein